ncbi:MAG TPA: hypothetical protein VHE13_15050 [Opitutus sp.]|nr:hypothetical protein [Opitutus sp.]
MKKLVALFLGSLLPFAVLRADTVLINFQGDQVTDQFNVGLVDGSLVLLVANVATPSTAGAGFGLLEPGTLNIGDLLNGEYQILGRGAVAEFSLPGEFAATTGAIPLTGGSFPNLSTGDQLAILWFPDLAESTDFSLVAGTSYGLYTVDADTAWQVPVGGTPSFDVTVPSGTAAAYTVAAVPEPSAFAALAGLSVLGWRVVRRRRAAA